MTFGGGYIRLRADEPIGALNITWGSFPGPWTLESGEETRTKEEE